MDAQSLAAAFDEEPLFHMSLASKELFHSNFFWWLARKHPEAARAVFAPWTETDTAQTSLRVTREASALDVVFHMPGLAPLVVENKVFSLPDLQQLDRYAQEKVATLVPKRSRATRKPPSLILLSLADPGWLGGVWQGTHGMWRRKGYEELRTGLAAQVDLVRRANAYEAETVAHYCNLVRLLLELAELVRVRSDEEDVELDEKILAPLEERRIADAAKKLRMYQVADRLKERLRDEECPVSVAVSLTRKQPLLEGFVKFDGLNDVGWQYQSGAFCLAMRVHEHAGRTRTSDSLRREFVRGHQAWFDFARATEILGPHVPSPKMRLPPNEFYSFAPDFLYRQHAPARVTIGQLVATACYYSRQATSLAATATKRER